MALRATASPVGPRVFSGESSVSTTDATETTLATITVPEDDQILLTARVKAARIGGTGGTAGDAAGYIIHAMLQNLSGTAEIIGQAAVLTAEDVAGYACAIDVTGATARIRVTGVADTNITWQAVYETY